jgi:hypothetical protein
VALEIIGPGFGRTGTNSLRFALNELGLGPTHHMHEIGNNLDAQMPGWLEIARGGKPNWDAVFAGYRAQVDWPGARYWRELIKHYPAAKVVLSTRDPDKWFDSVAKTIAPLIANRGDLGNPVEEAVAELADLVVNQQTFGGHLTDRAVATKIFRDHIATVKAEVPASRLLVWDVSQGWEPLCSFLKVAVPVTPFPNTNNADDFNDHSKTIR